MLEDLLAQGRRALAAVAQPWPASLADRRVVRARAVPGEGRTGGEDGVIHSLTKIIPGRRLPDFVCNSGTACEKQHRNAAYRKKRSGSKKNSATFPGRLSILF